MKSKKNETAPVRENIVDSGLSQVLVDAFDRYAKAVITDRAIPDVRDGLKPVQRRIIFDMASEGQVSTKPTVKCATIVGHIMGHFHPHGDSSIYDALVHLSQPWKMEAPLIDFQGNNGSMDDDPAAAYRYTEAKLSPLADYLIKDIDKATVDMVPTFDDKALEPTVLPALFPNLLVNGTSGIAVGSTTFIPSHNLTEVIDATLYRLQHKRANLDNLLQYIQGPDFATGGIIDDKASLRTIYETGQGTFSLYAKTEVNDDDNTIIIREIPFGLVKIDFVAALARRKESDNLDNIEEIVDESAKDDVEIVIKIKKGASPYDVLNYLQSKGALKNNISCNFLAIDKGHPKTMSLLEILDAYIEHQRDIQTKACRFDLNADKERLEIVDGLVKAYPIISELIEKIKACSGKEGVKTMLAKDYGFTDRQAEAIAMLPLYRLSNTDITALRQEKSDLETDITRLNDILADPEKLDKLIAATLKEVEKTFGTPRKTAILDSKQTFDAVDATKLIAKEDCYVAITGDGYAKRASPKSFLATSLVDGGKSASADDPLNLPKMKPGDHLVFAQSCSTHDNILFFTSLGNYGYLPVYLLTDLKWKDEGKHLNNLLTLKPEEKIIKAFLISDFKAGLNVVILTAQNKIKRTALTEFTQTTLTRHPLRAAKLLTPDDQVVGAEITSGNSDVIVCDAYGHVSRYNESEIPLVSVSAVGVKAIANSVDNAPLVSLVTLTSAEASLLLVIASQRAARVLSSSKIGTTARLSYKTSLVRIFKKNPMTIIALAKVTKVRGEDSFVATITPTSLACVNIHALDPVELDSEMRSNIPSLGKEPIVSIDDFGGTIDDSFPVETPKEVKVSAVKASVDKADTQLSLFDLFEKENGTK